MFEKVFTLNDRCLSNFIELNGGGLMLNSKFSSIRVNKSTEIHENA